ncbi:MAG: hypothetical protein WCP21_09880 [Armatimonadota bacterium]
MGRDNYTREQSPATDDEALFPLYCRHCHRPVPREFSNRHAGLCRECLAAKQRRAAVEAAAREAAAEAERLRRETQPPPLQRDLNEDEFEDAELGLTP